MVGQIKMIENPKTASWDLDISDADFAKFRRANVIRDLDDKWAFVPLTPQDLANQLIGYFGTTGGDSIGNRAVVDNVLTNELPADEESTDEDSVDEESAGEISIDEESKDSQDTQLTDEESVDEDPAPLHNWEHELEPWELEEEDDDDEPPTLDLHQPGYMSIVRAWTGYEYYRFYVKPREGDNSAKIVFITWDPNQYPAISFVDEDSDPGTTEEIAKMDVVRMCRAEHLLECDLEAAPEYD